MTDFTAVTGLEFNEEKTGTVRLGAKIIPPSPTPSGPNRVEYSSSSEEDIREADSESDDNVDEMKDAFDPLPQGDIRWVS